jgi:hypothetical protein
MSAKTARVIGVALVTALICGCESETEHDPTPGAAPEAQGPDSTSRANPRPASRVDRVSRRSGYRAEIARIEAAKPEDRREFSTEELIKNGRKVRDGGGWTYIPPAPERTATGPAVGCASRTYRDGGRDVALAIPQPPGVTAKRIGPRQLRVTYRVGRAGDECRVEWLEFNADVNDDPLPGFGKRIRVRGRSGHMVLRLIDHVADADVLHATAATSSGLTSEATAIRIR